MTVNTSDIWNEFSHELHQLVLKVVPDNNLSKEISDDILRQINYQMTVLKNDKKVFKWFEATIKDIILVYAEANNIKYSIKEGQLSKIKGSTISCLKPFIKNLHKKHQQIIELSFEYSQKEISEKMNISLANTKQLVSDARNHLSKMFFVANQHNPLSVA